MGTPVNHTPRQHTLTIPAPCDWISANRQEHWAPRARRVKAWRLATWSRARHEEPFDGQVDVFFEFHKALGRNVRWDPANLAPTAKACLDGIVDAKILVDDDSRHVRAVSYSDGGRRERPAITITIKEVETR